MDRSRLPLLAAVLLALAAGTVLRLHFLHAAPQLEGDPLLYGDIAKNWLTHGIYGRTVGSMAGVPIAAPTLIRLPGYPAFLALCFAFFGVEHYRAVCLAQLPVDLASCLLIGAFVRRVVSTRAGIFALWLAALCPFTANYVAIPLTETLSIFCVALALYAASALLEGSRLPAILLSAFAWSFAALLRPDGVLLGVALCAALLLHGLRARWRAADGRLPSLSGVGRSAAAAALLSVLPFVPWTLRNWHTFHVFQPLAPRYANDPGEPVSPGVERWTKTWMADFVSTFEFYWNVPGADINIRDLPSRAFDNSAEYRETRDLFAAYGANDTVTPEIDAGFSRLARRRIHAHPLRYYLMLPLLRLADMWLRPRVEMFNIDLRWWQYSRHHRETCRAAAYGALNLVYLAAGVLGIFHWPGICRRKAGKGREADSGWFPRWIRGRALGIAMLGYILLRSLLLATIEAPEPRYTLECFPIVISFAAAGLSFLLNSSLNFMARRSP